MTIKKPDLEKKTDFPPESKIGEKLLQENIITAQQIEALDKQKSSGVRIADAWGNYFVEMTVTPKSDPQVDLIFRQNHKGN